MRVRRSLALCLLLVLGIVGPLTGCARAAKTAQSIGLDDTVNTLAAGGIAVVDDVTTQKPLASTSGTPSAMRFTRFQTENMLNEANAHVGYLGSELDALATPPAGAPPLTTLIGAWLTKRDGPLAQYAAGIMGTNDYKQSATLVFPTIVVLAFIGDIARVSSHAQAEQHRFDFERFIAAPAEAQDDACSAISGWVSGVVNTVTAAIQSNGTGWIDNLWNTVVTIAGAVVSVVVNGLLKPLLGFLTHIATICGTIMQVATMFKPWTVTLEKKPASMQLSETPGEGQFVATLHASDIPWPATLVGCVAALSHVNLKDATYKDARVTWTPIATTPGLAHETSDDATLRENKTAIYNFETRTQPAVSADACPQSVPAGTVGVKVSIARTDVSHVLDSLENAVLSELTAGMQSYLQPYIGAALTDANSTVGEFASPHESGTISVSQLVAGTPCTHTAPPATTTPSATPAGGHATLPSGTCRQILTATDTAPLNGGIVFDPIDDQGRAVPMGDLMGKMMTGQLFSTAGGHSLTTQGTVVHDRQYDTSETSFCTIGTPPHTIAAIFGAAPKGTDPYHVPDVRALDAQNPQPCRSTFGISLLETFQADCDEITGTVTTVKITGPNVEYLIIGIPVSAIPNNPGATQSQLEAVLKHILDRSH
jgi:hypothetical protein